MSGHRFWYQICITRGEYNRQKTHKGCFFMVDITGIMISCLRTLTHGQRYEEVHTSSNKTSWRALGTLQKTKLKMGFDQNRVRTCTNVDALCDFMWDKQLALFTKCPTLTSTAAYSTFQCYFLSPDKLNLIVIQLISPFSRCYCLPSSRKTALPLSNAARDKKAFQRLSSLHSGLKSQMQQESNQSCKLVKLGVDFKQPCNVWNKSEFSRTATLEWGRLVFHTFKC